MTLHWENNKAPSAALPGSLWEISNTGDTSWAKPWQVTLTWPPGVPRGVIDILGNGDTEPTPERFRIDYIPSERAAVLIAGLAEEMLAGAGVTDPASAYMILLSWEDLEASWCEDRYMQALAMLGNFRVLAGQLTPAEAVRGTFSRNDELLGELFA